MLIWDEVNQYYDGLFSYNRPIHDILFLNVCFFELGCLLSAKSYVWIMIRTTLESTS